MAKRSQYKDLVDHLNEMDAEMDAKYPLNLGQSMTNLKWITRGIWQIRRLAVLQRIFRNLPNCGTM
jgi:hypothetical protein